MRSRCIERNHGPGAKPLLFALGVSVSAPQFEAPAVDLAAQELGYRIFDFEVDTVMTESSPELVILTLWKPIWTLTRIEFTALLLGAAISVMGFLVHDGVRLQRDTAGLV